MKKSKNIKNSKDLLKLIKSNENVPVEKVCRFCKESKMWRELIDRQSNEDKKMITDLVCRLLSAEETLEWLEMRLKERK